MPLRLVLARTEEVAVAVTDATAYPTGFELRLVIRSRAAGYGGPGDDPRAEVDAQIVLDAAARAEVLWDDEDEGGPDLGRGVQIRIR